MIKASLLSASLQIFPSVLAVFLFYIIPKNTDNLELYSPFYISAAISLVKLFSDFGLSRAFIKTYSKEQSAHILSYFAKIYMLLACLLAVAAFVYFQLINDTYIILSIGVFALSLSMFFDGYMLCTNQTIKLYMIDALFYTGFYFFSIIMVMGLHLYTFLLLVSLWCCLYFLIKYYSSRINFLNLKKLSPTLSPSEKVELISSIKTSFSIALYKQVDRFLIISLFPPVLFSFYQVVFQILSKLMLAPNILSRQLLVSFSSGVARADFTKYYSLFSFISLSLICLISYFGIKVSNFFGVVEQDSFIILMITTIMFSYGIVCQYVRSFVIGYYGGSVLIIGDYLAATVSIFLCFFIYFEEYSYYYLVLIGVIYYFMLLVFGLIILYKNNYFRTNGILIILVLKALKLVVSSIVISRFNLELFSLI